MTVNLDLVWCPVANGQRCPNFPPALMPPPAGVKITDCTCEAAATIADGGAVTVQVENWATTTGALDALVGSGAIIGYTVVVP